MKLRITINGQLVSTAASVEEPPFSLYKWLNDIIAYPIDSAFRGIGYMIRDFIINPINSISAEIITLGVMFCAAGIMVSSIFGKASWWVNWMFVVFGGGIIWRVLI